MSALHNRLLICDIYFSNFKNEQYEYSTAYSVVNFTTNRTLIYFNNRSKKSKEISTIIKQTFLQANQTQNSNLFKNHLRVGMVKILYFVNNPSLSSDFSQSFKSRLAIYYICVENKIPQRAHSYIYL